VMLLDEPGLNLHAAAQFDLLRFIDDLSKEYQVVYTTHSPFMIDPGQLVRVRTIVDARTGTKISNGIQEKDPDTLFPLQAALGYDIAQNLFISPNNLVLEGVSDLLILTAISSMLQKDGRTGLDASITLVPVGGLDKVATFIALLKGNKLRVACLLDTFKDPASKARLEDLVARKVIERTNVRFYHEFSPSAAKEADLEDLFKLDEYLALYKEAYPEHAALKQEALDMTIPRVVDRIAKATNRDRFNHYRPAHALVRLGAVANVMSRETLDVFERMFKEVNKLFQ
jgi:predicted ATP-dependent endonuclease of OLD family